MIFSSDKPLFNRKYLLALVWLLPVAILLLSRLGPSSDEVGKTIAPDQLWVESEKPQLTIYFSQGAGLTTKDSARQALLIEGLKLRLDDPQVNELLYAQDWRVKPQSSSLYTALTISAAESIDSEALATLLDLLKQPPAIDWTPIIDRISAEAYLAGQNGRQRALDGLLSTDLQLTARTYVELIDQPIHLLFLTPSEPEPQTLESHAAVSSVQPGKASISVRSKAASTISLWQMAAPSDSSSYLAQQALGILISQSLAGLPSTRIQQQLAPQGSLLLIETTAQSEALAAALNQIDSDSDLVNVAIDQLEQRWNRAIEQNALAWSEAILLYNLAPESLDAAFKSLRADTENLLQPLLQQLQQGADRRARLFNAQQG